MGVLMGWDYLNKGSQGKPWAKRTEAERYQSKADRFAKAQEVAASKRLARGALANSMARDNAAALAARHGPSGAPDGSAIGPRFAGQAVAMPKPKPKRKG
jgi:hypothetical protein